MGKENAVCHRYLRRIFVFDSLTDDELAKIAAIVRMKEYKRNTVIFREGEEGEGLFFVIKGKIKLSKLSEEGKEKILHFCSEGDVFAEILLFDGGVYPATAETLENSEIGLIRHADMERVLYENSGITVKFLKVMAKRLREAQFHIRDLAFKDAYSRLASTLLNLSAEYGRQTAGADYVGISLNQQELANVIGTSRETVARIIGDWRRDGIIAVHKKEIIIKDKKKLAAWL
ncbi:MAG: Crp/Fnr family transcriptional regulator [Clostridia bacterium]|jgi:CRP/FNR family cyclic AMP-dependent transcriptional regulator|nr:Crp/Fnr family transcriptional regulator [Clostridia bacterium]